MKDSFQLNIHAKNSQVDLSAGVVKMPASLVIIDGIDMEVSPWGQRGQAAPWGHKLGAKHKPVQALPLLTDTVPQELMMGPKAPDMTSNEPWPGSVQGLQPEAEGNRARDRAGKKLQHHCGRG